MRTIYKYPIEIRNLQILKVPQDRKKSSPRKENFLRAQSFLSTGVDNFIQRIKNLSETIQEIRVNLQKPVFFDNQIV